MKVCHFVDLRLDRWNVIGGGVQTSIKHQRKALDRAGVDWTRDPSADYDVLHCNVLGPRSLYHLKRAKQTGRKTVIHVHWTEREFRDSFRGSNLLAPAVDWYTTTVYSSPDMLIPVSEFTRDYLRSKDVDVPMEVVSNGIDAEELDGFDDLDVDDKYGADGFTVVNLAQVFERKGLDDFLAVTNALSDTDFIWFGPYGSVLTPRSTKRKIREAPENVQFPGFVDDKREAFAVGDVFFFPSLEEHQPVAILEALYCGLPMVLRDIPQYEGWLEDGENCLKADSADGFEEQIRRLRDDPELRAEIARGAKETAEQHTLERIGEDLRQVYEELLDA